MRKLYILVDLAKRKVVFESIDEESCYQYEQDHQEKALYMVVLSLDNKYPCLEKLEGVAL